MASESLISNSPTIFVAPSSGYTIFSSSDLGIRGPTPTVAADLSSPSKESANLIPTESSLRGTSLSKGSISSTAGRSLAATGEVLVNLNSSIGGACEGNCNGGNFPGSISRTVLSTSGIPTDAGETLRSSSKGGACDGNLGVSCGVGRISCIDGARSPMGYFCSKACNSCSCIASSKWPG